MTVHLDDDTLALLALGDAEPDAAQRSHLATCDRCSRELDDLRRTVSIGRSSRDVELLAPPPRVWQSISAELGLGLSSQAAARDAAPEAAAGPAPDAAPPAPASVADRRSRSTGFARWWPVAAAALVVGILAGVAGAILWPTPSADVIAEAALDPLPTWDASGTARLEQSGSGSTRDLVVDLDAPTGTDLREVWLIDPATNGLVSLGQLAGASGRFTVPNGIDLEQFSVVDVSDEPADGNPAHSGDSIVRGELRLL
ncbi:anti-sigma factor [Leifsonia flava]|uniref:Anti-sigma factor n=1 Tax=Orlajensenia leifsoniae TaxID=2561933 RepID=A0A4Y9R0K1_9MICO|nr:anti-sigma factor [Leifsonia flava]TFV98000.1 anti-sigma factor [Leifsonia flava]